MFPFLAGLACIFLLLPVRADGSTTVWIDSDPAIGAPWREVDDGYALLLAFRSPELEIVGLSSTYGNAALPTTTRVAREFVQRFSAQPLVVHSGASSAADLGRRSDASNALARAVTRRGHLTYLALGPLTNFATFQKLHPQLARRVDRVIFVGGQSSPEALRFGRHAWLQIHDANVAKDPSAAAAVVASGIPLTLAPPEIGAQFRLTRRDLDSIARSSDAGAFLARRSGVWELFWRSFVGENGGPIFDALAVLTAARPELLISQRARAERSNDLLLYVPATKGNVTVQRGVSDAARRLFLERLTSAAATPARP